MNAEEIQQAIYGSIRFQELMQGMLPSIMLGLDSFTESSNNPNVLATKDQSKHVLNGALIVYLFSMWDTYFDKNAVQKYFRTEEKKRFYAFKHIRIVAGHNIDGNRKGNRSGQDRMDHAEKLDEIMSSDKPIANVIISHNTLDLSKSNAVLDCRQFMQDMAMRLAAGRISAEGPTGQVRSTSGKMVDVM